MLLGPSPASLGVGTGSPLPFVRLEIGIVRWKSSCQRRRLSRGAPPVTTKEVTRTRRSAAHQGEACVPGWVEVEGPAGHPHMQPFAEGPPPVLTVELEFPVD